MLDRFKLKSALVDSYVGAIVVGWLFAEGIGRLVTSITTPLTEWGVERIRQQLSPGTSSILGSPLRFPTELMVSQLIAAALLLLIAFYLLRWLYFPPTESLDQGQTQEPEESA